MTKVGIETREDLLHYLAVACELEHGLCLQYLYSAFSLKDSLSEPGINTQEQLNIVRKWKANMFHVGAQEMLHLTIAANLCTAVGGVVQLARPTFPQRQRYYPTKLPWRLDPFSFDTIRRYTYYERPDNWNHPHDPWNDRLMHLWDSVPESEQKEVDLHDPLAYLRTAPLPEAQKKVVAVGSETVGDLYAVIKQGFLDLPDVIIGDPQAQVEGFYVDFPQVQVVNTVADAVSAIDLIVSQGEGTRGDRRDSHYGVFMNIYNEYTALKKADPDFEPARRVDSNPLSRIHADNNCYGFRLIDDLFTLDVNDLCSDVYMTMLLLLHRFFATSDESRPELITLSRAFLRIMTGVIKALGETLTQLPMGPATPGMMAGPSFEINRDIQLLPYKRSAWIYIHERLRNNAARALELSRDGRAPRRQAIREALLHASQSLTQIADDFGKDLPKFGV